MEPEILYCQSCGCEAKGVYCAACGEKVLREQNEMRFSFFIKDTLEEVFSLDSKFFRTIRLLVTQPGFLTTEVLAGRKVPYLKPFRLFAFLVVLHFLCFSFFMSGDLFKIDRIPFFQLIPAAREMIQGYQVDSGLSHEAFAETLNPKIKDNMNIIFNFLVFGLGLYFKLLYYRSGRYYIEHLYFIFHLVSFGLIRNILLLPLLSMDWLSAALAISIATQLPYTFIALKRVYGESNGQTLVKLLACMFGFFLVFVPGLFLAIAAGIFQILY